MGTTIVIGGGVGPMAGVALHRHIIELTATDGRDQSHLSVVHISRSERIPDRTEYLLGTDPRNPGPIMADIVASVVPPGEEEHIVVGVPCNTFHAPEITDPFVESLTSRGSRFTFVNMISRTVAELQTAHRENGAVIGVLSTTGTRNAGIWDAALAQAGFSAVQIPEADQPVLHDAIYNRETGLKAVSPPAAEAQATVERFARDLIDRGATVLLPACTELPLVIPAGVFHGIPVVDPVRILAAGLVTAAGGSVRSSAL